MGFQWRLQRNAQLRMETVGRWLRAEREKKNIHPADAAYALGLDRSILSRIECGRRKLSLVEAENFAVYYGIRLEELATWRNQSDADETKNLESKPESDRILTSEEFAKRAEESKEKRKSARLRKRMFGANTE